MPDGNAESGIIQRYPECNTALNPEAFFEQQKPDNRACKTDKNEL